MTPELQPAVWQQLVSLRSRLPHALLLHGAAGVGKLQLAERFAQLLLCEASAERAEPCLSCDACRWFLAGNHPDVRTIEPEALARAPRIEAEEGERAKPAKPSREIKIEQVRGLADFVYVGSHRGGLRVAILHPAEDMNASSANALLKSLEEPPAGAVFILVSHRPAQMLPTIRSRCVAVPVAPPEAKTSLAWLAAQGLADPAHWLAYAGGAPRKALEIASGENAAVVAKLLHALDAEAFDTVSVPDRETLELLAEALQKMALDKAFRTLGGQAKYRPGLKSSAAGAARPWLAYARVMGRNRLLARHPLNPRLFAVEMLSAMPDRK